MYIGVGCTVSTTHIFPHSLGHLLFEMSCGYELTKLSPGDEEYESIKDSDVREILRYIFRDDFSNSIEKVPKSLLKVNESYI